MKKFLLLFIVVIFMMPSKAFGAAIFFGVHSNNLGVGATFETGVFLDTQNESANVAEGKIIFPADSLEFEGLRAGNSMFPLWIQSPALISKGVVSFSGLVPGGFTGPKGYVFSLIFKTLNAGVATIATTQERVLLNDGNGSETKIVKAPLTIRVANQNAPVAFNNLDDKNPPEIFEPQVGSDSAIFNGKYFVTFIAEDKGSGIDHYEIMEREPTGSFTSIFEKPQWIVSDNPYLLKDQTLESIILVKAVDLAGNERTVSVVPSHSLPWYKNYIIWIILIVILIFSYVALFFYGKKK